MKKHDFTDLKFFIPTISKQKLRGKIYWNSDKSIILAFDNTIKRKIPFNSMEIIYAKDLNGINYSLIGCFPKLNTGSYYEFYINEVLEGEYVKPKPSYSYSSILLGITYLSTWHKSVIRHGELEKDSLFQGQINLLKPIIDSYEIEKGLKLEIEANARRSYENRIITVEADSFLAIKTIKKTTKNKLFSYGCSFLNILSLFTTSRPTINSIKLKKNSTSFQNVFMSFEEKNSSSEITKILIFHREISDNFLNILKKYFRQRIRYDDIINAFRAIKLENPEEAFLALTRCLEWYHKYFEETSVSKGLLVAYSKELSENGIKVDGKKSTWIQVVRYYHLLDISRDYFSLKNLGISEFGFVSKLRNTRNYLTHLNADKTNCWTQDEIKRINIYLKAWIRSIILSNLNIEKTTIAKVFKSETSNYIFLNHEDNIYSIFNPK